MGELTVRLYSDCPILARQWLTLSSAIQIYKAKIARERRIPFEISSDPFYSPENIAELDKRIKNMKNGKDLIEHNLIEAE